MRAHDAGALVFCARGSTSKKGAISHSATFALRTASQSCVTTMAITGCMGTCTVTGSGFPSARSVHLFSHGEPSSPTTVSRS